MVNIKRKNSVCWTDSDEHNVRFLRETKNTGIIRISKLTLTRRHISHAVRIHSNYHVTILNYIVSVRNQLPQPNWIPIRTSSSMGRLSSGDSRKSDV